MHNDQGSPCFLAMVPRGAGEHKQDLTVSPSSVLKHIGQLFILGSTFFLSLNSCIRKQKIYIFTAMACKPCVLYLKKESKINWMVP